MIDPKALFAEHDVWIVPDSGCFFLQANENGRGVISKEFPSMPWSTGRRRNRAITR